MKKKHRHQKAPCDMCGKVAYLYTVNIDKGIKERWCRECIDEEEK